MLSIETALVPIETAVKAKAIGISTYIRHALAGGIAAVVSFSTALAMQPPIADGTLGEYNEAIVAEATEEDLQILSTYMDENILVKIMDDDKTPAEVITSYVDYDESFKDVLADYFVD